MNRPLWPVLVVLPLILAATVFRIALALRPGLWGDEIFSLAMATGHSLEHPAADADPRLGDFVEPREAGPPSVFRRYTEQDESPAGARRVIRAVLLSDTSPPLYYLLLNRWTRAFGTGDAALRLFSVWWAVLSLPLLWLVGRELGRRRVAWTACLLFSFSPVAIYYSAEGRMYSLLWFLGLSLGWLTLELPRRESSPWLGALWVLAGMAGLLTHYFFGFVWLAALAWLWLHRGSMPHRHLAMLAGLTLLAVLPWYGQVPASLARWRVTGDWLRGALSWPGALGRPFVLAWNLLAGGQAWGGSQWIDRGAAVVYLLVAAWIVRQGSLRRMASHPALLLWAWTAATCAGPLVFDLLRHATTTNIPRYVLPGLPAVMLIGALALSQLPGRVQPVVLAALLVPWLRAEWRSISKAPRPFEPYPGVAAELASWARPDDVVLVHSVPTGVIGIARYLERDVPLASWVAPLGIRRVPDDLELLLRGRRRVALVKIHDLGGPAPAEPWLRAHGRLLGRQAFQDSRAEVLYFAPYDGETFFRSAIARQDSL